MVVQFSWIFGEFPIIHSSCSFFTTVRCRPRLFSLWIFLGLKIHFLANVFWKFENFSKDNLYFFTFSKCDLDSFCLENIDSLKEFLDLRKSSVKVGQVTFFSIFSTLVSSIFRDKCWTAYCICQPYILRRNIHKNKKKINQFLRYFSERKFGFYAQIFKYF